MAMESRAARGTTLFGEFVVLMAVAVFFGQQGDLFHDGRSFGTNHFEVPPSLVAPSAVEQLQTDPTLGSPDPRGQILKLGTPLPANQALDLLLRDKRGSRKLTAEEDTNGQDVTNGMPFPHSLPPGTGKNLWPK